MDEKKLQAFIQWLPSKYPEFQNQSPDEIAESLNTLYVQGEEGKAALQNLWQTFENESSTSMFKKGGKLQQLVTKLQKGGKNTKKCSCGCEIISQHKDGGIIEQCACGCKLDKSNQVESYQQGGIPLQHTSKMALKFSTPYTTQKIEDDKGTGYVAQMLTGDNTLYRLIERPSGHYTNKTWQIIEDQGTPKADTTFITPRGMTVHLDNKYRSKRRRPEDWIAKFNEIFGTQPIKH